ncbi:flagellar assembly protein FliH [Sporolactobacillus sp. CQH2019]|uniref:flagellar assembly protein FliH n=1 Tax=Sporolactobacillus sp. CQH2019 TaxID=3023512 RepID=UPI002367862D|nr:flagellar assembly protein FliH [Sporolactobacillus sp. CQH2019]MDD9147065.1 flagellar assembly protein FliH [Sporolactobacillus sp. CQH2019]
MSNLIKSPEKVNDRQVIGLSAAIDPELDALNSKMDRESVERSLEERIRRAKREAAEILEEAGQKRLEFDKQMENDAAEAKKRRDETFRLKEKEGYEAGFKKGASEGEKSFESRVAQANQLINQARAAYRSYLEDAEPEILKLSMAVAEKIIGISLALDKDKWFSLVSKAVHEAKDQETIKITVSPDRFEVLNQRKNEMDSLVQDAKIFIYADGDFAENDCTIETAFGKIVASVDSQLSVIKEKLKELMEEKRK